MSVYMYLKFCLNVNLLQNFWLHYSVILPFRAHLDNMRKDGGVGPEAYGSDTEMTAFATMTETSICSYYGGTWRVYNPIDNYKGAGGEMKGPCLYLLNSGNH